MPAHATIPAARLAPMLCSLVLLVALAPRALAQPEHALDPRLAAAMGQADKLDPPQRLGARAAILRAAQKIIPTVVVVPDAGAYTDAIAAWDADTRFPVLIDDGSPRAREDIARFVRAFKPESVVRWNNAGAPLPQGRAPREKRIRDAWADALAIPDDADDQQAIAALRARGITPPGLVVTSATDPAWTGALALAAGRNQVLAFVADPGGIPAGAWDRAKLDRLATDIEQLAEATGLLWRDLGDDLDALTLALDAPLKTKTDPPLAVSDLLGRADEQTRWAWCSQLIGSEPESAYRAMSALFLETHAAWTFDAYPGTGDWARYDNAPAVDILTERGVGVTDHHTPFNGLADWRAATLEPIDADIVLVNTKGVPTSFDLSPGRGVPGDTPHLDRPVILHLVHSFSLAWGDARSSVGGRWLERGAYASLGSVDEPYLQAFIPPHILVGRMAVGYPWGAAVRADRGPPWKLATLGDPLVTLSTAGARTTAPLPLDAENSLEDEQREHLSAGRHAECVRTLAMLGRDEDAAAVVIDLTRDDAPPLTPELALNAVPPLYRSGHHRACVVAALAAAVPLLDDPIASDMAWTAARGLLARDEGDDTALAIALMRRTLRGDQLVSDTIQIADAIRRTSDSEGAAAFVDEVVAAAPDPGSRRDLAQLAADYRAGRR